MNHHRKARATLLFSLICGLMLFISPLAAATQTRWYYNDIYLTSLSSVPLPATTLGLSFFNDHFLPERNTAELEGRSLVWAELGARDGRPLVFVVGWPHFVMPAAALYSPLNNFMKRKGIRLIVVERTGASSLSTFDPTDTLDTYVRDIENLTKHLEIDEFAVLGYSAGGPGALAVAAKMPHRVHSLHLVAARGRYEDSLAARTGEADTSARLLADPLSNAPRFQSFAPARQQLPPDVTTFLDANFGPEFLDRTLTAAFADTPHHPEGISLSTAVGLQPWSFTLGDVVAPTFIYHGLDDRVISSDGYPQDTAARVSGQVTARFYAGEDHFTTLLKSLDQIISDVNTLGAEIPMCVTSNGRKQTENVRKQDVAQLLLSGARYGNCAWK